MSPDLWQRQHDSAQAKKAMLEKFRAEPRPDDPIVAARRAAREAMQTERAAGAAKREAARLAHEAELAKQALRTAELAAQAEREAAEAAARAAAEQAGHEAAVLGRAKGCARPTVCGAQGSEEAAAEGIVSHCPYAMISICFRKDCTRLSEPKPHQ
jgi:hypothetical protein